MQFDLTASDFRLDNARILALMAREVYGPEFDQDGVVIASGPMLRRSIVDTATDTHIGLFIGEAATYVVARGSKSIKNWITDFDAFRENLPQSGCGWIHKGFDQAASSVFGRITAAIQLLDAHVPIVVTGHSLGGSLALILGYWLASKFPGRVNSIYALEPAKVGGAIFKELFDGAVGQKAFCITHGADIVPWVPPANLGYRRVGQEIFFSSVGGTPTGTPAPPMINPSWWRKLWSDKWEFLKEFVRLKKAQGTFGFGILGAGAACPLLADHPIDAVIARLNQAGMDPI